MSSRTDNPFAAEQKRAWEQAMQDLEFDLGTHARPGLTWREVYKNTAAVDVYRRNPTRPPAAGPQGDELKKAKRITHTKMILARNAYEGIVAEYESLGGNRDDSEA
ncbi:MAG: hypothetical protein ACLPTF_04830 [Steroidobacteraceae bacterium]